MIDGELLLLTDMTYKQKTDLHSYFGWFQHLTCAIHTSTVIRRQHT